MSRHRRNPPWAEEELILALDLYLRCGTMDARRPEVVQLSKKLNELEIHSDRPDKARFRNANGVALKLANFAALDPDYPGKGMRQGGKLDATIWARYSANEDTVAAAAADILDSGAIVYPEAIGIENSGVFEVDIEAQHVFDFTVSKSDQPHAAHRKEQRLVLDFAEHLSRLGHTVKRHLYAIPGETGLLACDLVDQTENVLYEAKSDIRRRSLRMAIGQLMDYRRFEPETMRLAVLLPRGLTPDLHAFVLSIPVSIAWRSCSGWATSQH